MLICGVFDLHDGGGHLACLEIEGLIKIAYQKTYELSSIIVTHATGFKKCSAAPEHLTC